MVEKAGSVTIVVLAIVGFFAILVVVFQQHNIKTNYNNKRASVKRELDTQEWFEFKRDVIIVVPKSGIDYIEVGESETILHWGKGRSAFFMGNEEKELLRFAGLPHLIKEDDEL